MEKKALLGVVVSLLTLSHVTSVPATRILVAKQVNLSSAQDHHANKAAMGIKTSTEEAFEMKEEAREGRMMMDVVDYSGPGHNRAHDPKSPGKPGF